MGEKGEEEQQELELWGSPQSTDQVRSLFVLFSFALMTVAWGRPAGWPTVIPGPFDTLICHE